MNFDSPDNQDITSFISSQPRSNKITSNRAQPKQVPARKLGEDSLVNDSFMTEQTDLEINPVRSNKRTPSAPPSVNQQVIAKPKARPSTLRSSATLVKPAVQSYPAPIDINNISKPETYLDNNLDDIPVQSNRKPKPATTAKPVQQVKTIHSFQTLEDSQSKTGGQPEPSYVYFIRQINNAKSERVPFRVGFTSNVAHERDKLEQSALYKMLTYKIIKCTKGDALKVFEDFAARMNTVHIRNSWFNISKEEIDNFVSILCISSDYVVCTESKAK